MPVQEEEWLALEIPLTKEERDLLAYFGIPPSPQGQLSDNIREKRKFWHRRSNGLGEHERARRVKELIQQLSEHLLNGVPFEGVLESGPGGPRFDKTTADTLEELRRLIDDLLRRGSFRAAVDAGWRGVTEWNDAPLAHMLLAYAVATALDFRTSLERNVIEYALKSAEYATSAYANDEMSWSSRIGLMVATGMAGQVDGLRDPAARALGTLSPDLRITFASAVFATGQRDRGLAEVVQALYGANIDLGVRADAASQVIRQAAMPLLPLKSAADAAAYRDAVAVAAWCATGIPDAEELVRPHRFWAAACMSNIYSGNWQIRTFLSVCTGFLLLPVLNAMRGRPAWQIFIKGPLVYEEFLFFADFDFMRSTHAHCGPGLPWLLPDGKWPTSPQDVAYLQQLAQQAAQQSRQQRARR
jgi:hypothetical protein